MARAFDGTSGVIATSIGACQITAPVTGAAILRKTSDAGIQAFLSLCSSSGSGGRLLQFKTFDADDALGYWGSSGDISASSVGMMRPES